MILTLYRQPPTDGAILGHLFIDGQLQCRTLERADVAIPAGKYPVVITPSQHFGRLLPRVLNVPGRSGILIHAGNQPDDSEGCILVGQRNTGTTLMHSRDALQDLQAHIAQAIAHQQDVELLVIDATTPKTVTV